MSGLLRAPVPLPVLQGDVAFVARDYAAAAEAYSQSLRHDTRSAVVWANRAAAYLKLGRRWPFAALRPSLPAMA